MNGSAVALGLLLAASRSQLPVNLDVWLALAQNHISPGLQQNDVVTALNGTTIEIIHTDAEGRMVLADTLSLASREKPDALLDFATLTGSMAMAMGARYSGIFSNRDKLLAAALAAGKASGERVNPFPSMPTTRKPWTATSPTSSNAPWKATPTTSWRRASCCASSKRTRRGCTWTSPPATARAGWARWLRM